MMALHRDRHWSAGVKSPIIGAMDYRAHISINPAVRSGKPCVKGTRITVFDVLDSMSSGMSVEEIVSDFPQLTREAVLACLGYAADRERKVSPTRA